MPKHILDTSGNGRRKKNSASLERGNSATMILAILRDGAGHGYHIAREVERRSNFLLTFNDGNLYSILHALEEDELIVSEWEKVSGERERRIYRLTPKGESELERLLAHWDAYTSAMNGVFGRQTATDGQAG